MVLRTSALTLFLLLSGCARRPEPLASPVVNDKSVTFPLTAARDAVKVAAPGQAYELDGELLRALTIAANDLFPPGASASECRNLREAHTFRVIRQEGIIFVYIDEDLEYCGHRFPAMDSGAKYAISGDGRILRRVVDGIDEDDGVWRLKTPDGGGVTVIAEPGVIPDLTSLDAPDSGVLKVIPDAWPPPGEPLSGSTDGGSRTGMTAPGNAPSGPPQEVDAGAAP
ncbi:hypothetical protein [Pyxidicoccus xibeiensis]|uniref:hypothetical protein n=1 Tax=Pyxidicoccus xibeiensis TaxID=2906759 RepID=UPI0020A7B388|nr:hypothetical protein [Pyxidicoccus xibeiensis]MCP3136849.1 hypothetical protein [Pyxidicoccus xibeiensis]